jgi:serine/threonine-protein kinase
MALAVTCTLFQGAAGAQPARDPAGAEKLFAEARKLLDAGKYAEACQRLADSQKLDPGVGTLLNLAQCYEKMGRTATAWATYHEAAAAARANGQAEREKKASRAADGLEANLSKLTVTVPEAAAAKGVEVKRNGTPVPESLWGVSEPVDPGEYVIEARAAGKKAWSTHVKAEPGRATAVILPPLEEAATDAAPPAPMPTGAAPSSAPAVRDSSSTIEASSSGIHGQRLVGVIVGGSGLVLAGVGAVLAFSANATYDATNSHCNSNNMCDAQGISDRDAAKQRGTIATGALVAGGLAFAAGVTLWLTAPSPRADNAQAPRLRVSAAALPGANEGSVVLMGNW